MKMIIRVQQVIYFLILLLWGQALIQYVLNDSYGNRFLGSAIFSGTALAMLFLSFIKPKYLTLATSVLVLVLIGIVTYIIFYL